MRRLPLYQAVVACSRSLGMKPEAIAVAFRLELDQVEAVLRAAGRPKRRTRAE